MMLHGCALLLLVVAAIVGCGSSGSSSSSSTSCPAAEPTVGTACDMPGLTCAFQAKCGPVQAACSPAMTWTVSDDCCPEKPPTSGSPCSMCCEGRSCSYSNFGADCVMGMWKQHF